MKAKSHWAAQKRDLWEKKNSPIFPTPLSRLKDDLDVILKLSVFGGMFGACILLVYFYSIDFPEVFLPAIGSPQVLLAFFLAAVSFAVYLSVLFVIPAWLMQMLADFGWDKGLNIGREKAVFAILMMPIVFATSAGLVYFGVISYSHPMYMPMVLLLTFVCLLLLVVWKKLLRNLIAMSRCTFSISHLINKLRLLNTMLRTQTSEILTSPKEGSVWQGVLFSIYVTFCSLLVSLPMFLATLFAEGKDGGEITYVLGYLSLLAFIVWFGKPKMVWVSAFMILVLLLALKSPIITAGVAQFLGVRHDDLRWYWVNKEAAANLIPKEICLAKRAQGSYIAARSPFLLGDTRVLCTCSAYKSNFGNKSRKVCAPSPLDACVVLDKTEAKSIDSRYFEGDDTRCLACDTPQSGA